MSSAVSYVKMQGTGNDFVLVDLVADVPQEVHQRGDASMYHVANESRVALSKLLHQHLLHTPRDWEFPKGVIRRISDRQLGVGCDQFVVLCDGNVGDADVDQTAIQWYITHSSDPTVTQIQEAPQCMWVAARIYNGSDGGEVGMCGNAVRCIAMYWFLKELARGSASAQDVLLSGKPARITVYLPRSHRCLSCDIDLTADVVRRLLATFQQQSTASFTKKMVQLALVLDDAEANVAVCLGLTVAEAAQIPCHEESASVPLVPIAGGFMLSRDDVLQYLRSVCNPFADLMDSIIDEVFVIGIGNPHLVLVAKRESNRDERIENIFPNDVVDCVGSALCGWKSMFPKGINVEFVSIKEISETYNRARMRVFERGAGRTLACGSGACAAGVVVPSIGASRLGTTTCATATRIEMDGGELDIHVSVIQSLMRCSVVMKGAASFSAFGDWLPQLQ